MADAVIKDDRVQLRNAAGGAFSVSREEAQEALDTGEFRLETPEEWNERSLTRERSTLGQQALTAGEGALRGATFGLGTAAAAELGGEEYREAARERAAVNPRLSVAGEVVGAIAPALLSGGGGAVGAAARFTPAGLAARAGHAVERGAGALAARAGLGGGALASRVAAEAIKLGAAGAVEGAAYGLGSSLADSALEGTEWTAERALAGIEHGLVHGGLGGAALGAGGVVIGKAGRAVLDRMVGEGKTFRQAVQEFADGRTIKAVIGNDAATFRKLTNNGENMGRIERVAEKLRARNIVGGTADDMFAAIGREADDAGKRLADVATELDKAGIRPSSQRFFASVDDQVRKLRDMGTVEHAAVARRVERQVEGLRASSSVRVAHPDGTVTRVQRDPTFAELRKFRTGLGKVTAWHKATRSMATEEMQRLYSSVSKTLDEAADAAGGNAARLWRGANEDMSDFLTLRDGLKREMQAKAKNRYVSPSDYGTGLASAIATMATGGGAPAAVMHGLAASVAHKFVRERGSAVIGRIADWVAGIELRSATAARRMAGTAAVGARGARRTPLERLKATAERGALPTAEARDARQRADARRALLGGWLPIGAGGERRESYEATARAIREVQRDPGVMLARIEQTIAPIASSQPEVAGAMARRMVADYQWLNAKLPASVSSFGRTLGPPKPPLVSRGDQRKFLSYVGALADPIGVFEDAADGKIDFDAFDAVKARRPDLFESMRGLVAVEVGQSETVLPHGQRVFLSIAFGLPLDAALETGALDPSATEPNQGNGPELAAPSALDPKAETEGMTTPAQQSEQGAAA